MTETIRCPGCSTSYGLRPERVQEGIRRAKCFRCDTIFDIGHEVERLLAAGPVPPALPEEPSPFAVFEPVIPPSLTLGDLEGGEDEIMETTLVNFVPPEPDAPVAEAPVAEPPVAEMPAEPQDPTATGGFSSAKDAVAKLMGNAPAPAPPPERRTLGSRSPMDVEATLDALDATLSGGFAPSPAPPSLEESGETASTMKLSAHEIQAAMAAFASRPRTEEAPPAFRPPPPRPEAPPRVETPAPVPDPSPAAPELLKIQVEQEILNNVTIDQVSGWIEQGRVLEYHLVARQFSDHWIEASKVPALRPIFDRKRREEIGLSLDLSNPPSSELAPPRKSLFGGLFGRN